MLKVATKFTPDEDAFETAVAAGCRHAEFWLNGRLLDDWSRIADLASRYSLGYGLHFPNKGDLDDQTLENASRLYHQLDCTSMVIHQPMLDRCGARLLEIDPTLRLGLENHRLKKGQFEEWATNNTWLTLDVEHLWKYTWKDAPLRDLLDAVRDFLARFHDKLIHVHMPGYVPGYAEHRPMYCNRDLALPVMSMLADHNFDGLVVSEVNPAFQNVRELRMDVLLYEHWLESRDQETSSSCVA